MELSMLCFSYPHHHRRPLCPRLGGSLRSSERFSGGRLPKKQRIVCLSPNSSNGSSPFESKQSPVSSAIVPDADGRRWFLGLLLAAASGVNTNGKAGAVSSSRRALRGSKIPEIQVHYVAKWKGITFMTSRQGLGVTGGTPYGFDVGQSERGTVLKGLDLGVQGMRVGGQRLLIVPPELAYGKGGVQEIPPNATIELDVELLSIKRDAFGTAVKIVEG